MNSFFWQIGMRIIHKVCFLEIGMCIIHGDSLQIGMRIIHNVFFYK